MSDDLDFDFGFTAVTEDELEDPALVRDMFREYLVS